MRSKSIQSSYPQAGNHMSDKYSTINARASYGIGRQVGDQLGSQPIDGLDIDALLDGIADALEGEPSQVSENDLRVALEDLNRRMQQRQQEQTGVLAARGEVFLETNAQRDGIEVTASGLQYEVLQTGNGGATPGPTSTVKVHYHGTLLDGTTFDSSVQRGEPIEFPVNGVISGWTEALQMMSVGDKWKLFIPHHLAYGAQGAGGVIGPYETLIFEVELLAVR
jgi:FKBP-type peptidyl-prolyl cis-trans isomerase FklB